MHLKSFHRFFWWSNAFWLKHHLTENQLTKRYLTESPYSRTPFIPKFILPKKVIWPNIFLDSFHRKIWKMIIWTKINREHIFWLLVSYRAAEKVKYDFLASVWNFQTIEYHHALFWIFGTLAGSWPWANADNCATKLWFLNFFTITMKFLNDRVPSYLISEIWDIGRIRE
jgi:hypothetical protein